MKIYNEIEQGSTEWKKLRWGLIGGSSLKHIMINDVEKGVIIDQLIFERTEDFEDEDGYISADMQRGIDLEPFAREALEKETGLKFIVPGWIQSDLPILGISPDGVTECLTFAVETKCPTGKTHVKYLRDNSLLLTDYSWQIVDYFATIPKLQKLYVVSYRPESKIKKLLIVEVTRETEIKISTAAKCVPEKISSLVSQALIRADIVDVIVNEQINKLSF